MKIFDERGITLMELLATIVILSIVLPVIYGVFNSGLSLYNKIQIEGQLRDDADYAAAMILNSFNSIPFDNVQTCGENCIQLNNVTHTDLEKVETDNSSFYSIEKNQKNTAEDTSHHKIELVDKTLNKEKIKSVAVDGNIIDGIGNFAGSTFSLSCTQISDTNANLCEHGFIDIHFTIDQSRLKKPLALESQFGF